MEIWRLARIGDWSLTSRQSPITSPGLDMNINVDSCPIVSMIGYSRCILLSMPIAKNILSLTISGKSELSVAPARRHLQLRALSVVAVVPSLVCGGQSADRTLPVGLCQSRQTGWGRAAARGARCVWVRGM